jgi:hypothetical protein
MSEDTIIGENGTLEDIITPSDGTEDTDGRSSDTTEE